MLLFQTSREIIFYFQHFIQVCFYFLGKKTGGARAPPAPPLATALKNENIFTLTSSLPVSTNPKWNSTNETVVDTGQFPYPPPLSYQYSVCVSILD